MPRGANQKLKLLYLKQFFEEHTDEEHPATMQQMLDYLKANGVDAERKSIYRPGRSCRFRHGRAQG